MLDIVDSSTTFHKDKICTQKPFLKAVIFGFFFMCVCVCKCMSMCINTHIFIHIHAHTYTYIYLLLLPLSYIDFEVLRNST